jgi:stearoyl-CoA desaturase (Delta-9 desaturase)
MSQEIRFPSQDAMPIIAGVTPASVSFQKMERRIALIVVITPFLGLVAAILLFWQRGIRPFDLVILAVMYSLAVLGIGIGYHRLASHRSFETSSAIRIILTILGSMAAEGPVLYWAAIHRRHHKYSDQVGDPHSPHLHEEGLRGFVSGLWHAHMGWLFVHEVTDWVHYIPDLLRDRALFRVNRLYFLWVFLGLALPTAAGFLFTGTGQGALEGFLWGGLVRIFFDHHVTWSVNSICHVYGARPFQTKDESRNNIWMALPSFGEGWHNNHHAFPSSAYHGLKWWQLDLNGLVIRLLKVTGLAWNVKVPLEKYMQAKSATEER